MIVLLKEKLYFDFYFLTLILYFLTWFSVNHWFFRKKR